MANLVSIKEGLLVVKRYETRETSPTSPVLRIGNKVLMLTTNSGETNGPPRIKIGSHYVWEKSMFGQFFVNVVGGSGSGSYNVHDRVNVTYIPTSSIKSFVRWEGNISVPQTATTSFSMPAYAINLNAVEEDRGYEVKINGGSVFWTSSSSDQILKDGWYKEGETVTFTIVMSNDLDVTGWEGNVPNLPASKTVSFTMPGENVTLTPITTNTIFELKRQNIVGGTTSEPRTTEHKAGSNVSLSPVSIPSGYSFSSWTGWEVDDPTSTYTNFIMPSQNITLTANFVKTVQKYTVTVDKGTGDGQYSVGAQVNIQATLSSNHRFAAWTHPQYMYNDIKLPTVTIADKEDPSTYFTMPAMNVDVMAYIDTLDIFNFITSLYWLILKRAPDYDQGYLYWSDRLARDPIITRDNLDVYMAKSTINNEIELNNAMKYLYDKPGDQYGVAHIKLRYDQGLYTNVPGNTMNADTLANTMIARYGMNDTGYENIDLTRLSHDEFREKYSSKIKSF